MRRLLLRWFSGAAALVSLVVAAELTFEVDSGIGGDTTCRSLITHKDWSGNPCSNTMLTRMFVAGVLLIVAIVSFVVAARTSRAGMTRR